MNEQEIAEYARKVYKRELTINVSTYEDVYVSIFKGVYELLKKELGDVIPKRLDKIDIS